MAMIGQAGPKMDFFSKDKQHYMATLNPGPIWFTPEEYIYIRQWFAKHDQLVGYEEVASHRHLHVLFSSDTKKTGNVTRALETVFSNAGIPFTKGVTIVVVNSKFPVGHFHYLTHPSKRGTRVMLKGWTMTWIQEECRKGVKFIPRKVLRGDCYVVNNIEGPALIIKFAEVNGFALLDKVTFIDCVTTMQKENYKFHASKEEYLYTDVMALLGHMRAAQSLWESKLNFVD